jgi:uracil-DNA glycosylase
MNNDTPADADTSFVHQLDARQRAMLAEMGAKVWAPKRAAEPVAAVEASGTVAPAARVNATATASPRAPAAPVAATPAPASSAEPVLVTRPAGVEQMDWPELRAAVAGCEACGLCRSRKNTVFGAGDTQADWMVVGEAPGENEDLQGEPFVGVAGQLLDNMLRAIGRSRSGSGTQGVFIANALKCRPPANRNPLPQELAQCAPYLERQVALVQPRIILAMGRFAVQTLLQSNEPIGKLRGQVHRYQGVPVIVTYHPAYLLRTPADKAKAWADLCLAMETANSL